MKAAPLRIILFGISLGAVAACAETPPVVAVPVPIMERPVGRTHAPPALKHTPEIPPIAATRLATATAALGEEDDPDLDHARVLRALRELADAIAVIVPAQYVEVIAIERAADELETSPDASRMHTDYVRYGLVAALDALVDGRPINPEQMAAYRDAVTALASTIEKLDPDRPLLAQSDVARRAFQAATRAVFIAAGAIPPDVVSIGPDLEACEPSRGKTARR